MKFKYMLMILCLLTAAQLATGAPTHLVDEAPVAVEKLEDGTWVVDFGRVAFGNLRLISPKDAKVTVHFGEAQKDGRIDRKPPGTVRYKAAEAALKKGRAVIAAPAKDKRNTNYAHKPPAIRLPEEWSVILPFRWVEIEGWKGELKPEQVIRQSAYASTWDDDGASFTCSDEMLNRIWELCRYSIKATTFAGVYVDGDRERIPYEADSYLNQLSHYYSDSDKQMARDTIDYLMVYRTWPSEWPPHLVFMVYADWMHTGETVMVEKHYEALKAKILAERKADDGLIATNAKQVKKGDIVDWPKDERDGYVFTKRNTVVNAFHLRATELMAELARALGKDDEAAAFEADYRETLAVFQDAFFDVEAGLYKDGVDTDHHSLHANLFPLAFGLAPAESREAIADWLAGRGMACSVYAAQYLMEALFENGMDASAVALITAENDRSWRHMVESGTTITWEAWDQKYKPNQDWNHAWGAAPGNLLPRYVLGVEPLTPGWDTVRIRPHPAGLSFANGKIPTPRGPILVDWKDEDSFVLSLKVPEGMKVMVELPAGGASSTVICDGKAVAADRIGDRLVLNFAHCETTTLEVEKVVPPEPFLPVPGAAQLKWHKAEYKMFIHFGMKTYYPSDHHKGDGQEDPARFNPVHFDANQWVEAAKAGGFEGIVLTTKHHDGFCNWPTKTTAHSVASSPWKNGQGDVVKELVEACRKGGISFGFYVSIIDDNFDRFGSDKYETYGEFYYDQIREISTQYGPIGEYWFDGFQADRLKMDYGKIAELIRGEQPAAVVYDSGTLVEYLSDRCLAWAGNHGGLTPDQNYRVEVDGERVWYPNEPSLMLQGNWFHNGRPMIGLERIKDYYLRTTGYGVTPLMNISPNQDGLIDEESVEKLKTFKVWVDQLHANDLARGDGVKVRADGVRGGDSTYASAKVADGDFETYFATDDGETTAVIEVDLGGVHEVDGFILQEYIPLGQRVEAYSIECLADGNWIEVFSGKTIGYQRILLEGYASEADKQFPATSKVRLFIKSSLACPLISTFQIVGDMNHQD